MACMNYVDAADLNYAEYWKKQFRNAIIKRSIWY